MNDFKGMSDSESCDYQLKLWVEGKPIHNTVRDECCPDFSCCRGEIAPLKERERFAKACEENDNHTKMEMLGMFLGKAFESIKPNVIVVGTDTPGEA